MEQSRTDKNGDTIINIFERDDSKILEQLSLIIKNQKTIMAQQDEINAALAEIKDATTAIAARIQAFIDAGTGGVTEASLQELQADADALKAIGTPA